LAEDLPDVKKYDIAIVEGTQLPKNNLGGENREEKI